MSAFGRIADIARVDRGQEKPGTWPGLRFPGSGGPLWALLAHNLTAPLATDQDSSKQMIAGA